MMKNSAKVALLMAGTLSVALLAGCGATADTAAAADYSAMSLDEITAAAKEEGNVNSVGMPDTWANWIETWEDLNTNYGLTHTDLDMSSSEEIAMFKDGTDIIGLNQKTFITKGFTD